MYYNINHINPKHILYIMCVIVGGVGAGGKEDEPFATILYYVHIIVRRRLQQNDI